MTYPYMDFPRLTRAHLGDAMLFANREDLIEGLPIRQRGVIAEVGVALGDFSDFLLRTLKPSEFVAIDTFSMHEFPVHWGRSSEELFGGKSHLDFYRERFAHQTDCIRIEQALSHVGLTRYPTGYFDLIYVDAAHDYESVRRDADVASDRLKPDGTLVFNDYTMFDHLLAVPYGVVPAVNEIIAAQRWRVVGFALHQHMFCDIALRR